MSIRAFAAYALTFVAVALQAAPIIRTGFQQFGYGPDNRDYRYVFDVSGLQFLANDELDIRFGADLFASLSNAAPVDGFDILLFAPNNPPGSPGDFSALALRDFGDTARTFAVDVRYIGTGPPPDALTFVVNRFVGGANGGDPIQSDSGVTSPDAVAPEPATVVTTGVALAIAALRRMRRRATAPHAL